jgi:hypothetical protein
LVSYAWHARGNGYANDVKEQDWKTFAKRLQQSTQVLVEAKRLQEKCPVLWSSLQRVALGLQAERAQFDGIFEEAIQAFPDYVFFYNTRAVYLLPRWYGAAGELEKDLQKQADRVGGEAGDKLYARVVWSIHNYGGSLNVYDDNNFSWERTERGFDAILKEFPDSVAASNEAAHLAGNGGAPKSAQKFMNNMKGRLDLEAWQSVGEFQAFRKWAFGE